MSCPLEMAEENSPVTFGKLNQWRYAKAKVKKFKNKQIYEGFPMPPEKDTSTGAELAYSSPYRALMICA